MNNFFDNLRPLAHNSWRIVLGFAFMTAGGGKLFGIFGRDEAVDYMSRFGIAGFIEFFGGLLIMLGLFTRPAAFIASGQMAVAYWWMHAFRGDTFQLWHWDNGGRTVMMFSFTFLLLAAIGPGSFSLDEKLFGKKQSAAA